MCSRKSWQKLYILHVLFGIRHTWYWLLIRTWKMTFLGKGPWLHFMALLIHFSEHAHLRILKKCKHERLVTRRNHISRGVTGGQGGRKFPGRRVTMGRRITAGASKSSKNVTSTFFNTVNLLPKELRFEHGGVKLASCPGRHLTSLRPCT